MQRNSKLTILIVLMTGVVFVWVPKGKKAKDASSSASFAQALPMIRVVPKKRTEFVGWPRDPFAWPKGEEKVGSISNLTLSAIMWGDKKASAFINNSIVSVGDEITDKTVKQIEQNRVILTDGTNDYVLELQE